jgi:DNA-binding transcriptional LysR family regulator
LGLSEDFASEGLTHALSNFLQRNPNVELHIATGMSGDLFHSLDEGKFDLVFAKRVGNSRRGQVVRTERLYWCVGPHSPLNGAELILPLALHPAPSVSRTRVLETLQTVGRPYRITTVSSSVAVLKAAAMAGLGISAFADYVVPQGLVRLEHDMPDLGHLEFVIDKPAHASPAVCALESTLRIAALDI